MSFTKADVKAIIEQKGLDNLSAKSVRISLEEALGMEEGSLKSAKTEISEMIDAVLNEMPQADGDEDDEDEEEEEEKPAKKAKKARGTLPTKDHSHVFALLSAPSAPHSQVVSAAMGRRCAVSLVCRLRQATRIPTRASRLALCVEARRYQRA